MIEDKEIKTILDKERHKRWLALSMAIYDIEEKLGEDVKEFWYNNIDNSVVVHHKGEYLRYHLGEK